MNDSICASICTGTFLKQTKPIAMTLEEAKHVCNILQKIDTNNEIINNTVTKNLCKCIEYLLLLLLKHRI